MSHRFHRCWSSAAFVIIATGLAAAGGCGPKQAGEECSADGDCLGKRCLRGRCTAPCAAQTDCDVGWDCGLADRADTEATCYKRVWTQVAKGGYGTDCSTVSTDPKTGKSCNPGGTSPCADGFVCLSARTCDPAAICSTECKVDTDCPPTYFCGVRSVDKKSFCMKRTFCSPCGADDNCPPEHICATDIQGARYCAKVCHFNTDCPQPPNDENGAPAGKPFVTCQDDPTARDIPLKVCAPTLGLCHGPSAIPSVAGDGGVCAPCRPGIPSDCKDGLICYTDPFTTERMCTRQCTIKFQRTGSGYDIAGDSCTDENPDTFCYFGSSVPSNCGSGCSEQGICMADSAYLALTCYPL